MWNSPCLVQEHLLGGDLELIYLSDAYRAVRLLSQGFHRSFELGLVVLRPGLLATYLISMPHIAGTCYHTSFLRAESLL